MTCGSSAIKTRPQVPSACRNHGVFCEEANVKIHTVHLFLRLSLAHAVRHSTNSYHSRCWTVQPAPHDIPLSAAFAPSPPRPHTSLSARQQPQLHYIGSRPRRHMGWLGAFKPQQRRRRCIPASKLSSSCVCCNHACLLRRCGGELVARACCRLAGWRSSTRQRRLRPSG